MDIMMIVLLLFLVFGGGLSYVVFKLVVKPNLPWQKGPEIQNATMRGRTLILDKDRFGQAEVLEGKLLPGGRATFSMRDGSGVPHTYTYYLHHLESYNIFDNICGQGPPVYVHKRTKLNLENRDTEDIDKFEESERKRREADAEAKRAIVEIDERAKERVKDLIELEQAKERGYQSK